MPARTLGHSAAIASASSMVSVTAVARLSHAAAGSAARNHDDLVGSQLLELLLDHQARRLADGDQQNDGRHADDDSQHRQDGGSLFLRQGPKGCRQQGYRVHDRRGVGAGVRPALCRSCGRTLRRLSGTALTAFAPVTSNWPSLRLPDNQFRGDVVAQAGFDLHGRERLAVGNPNVPFLA